MKPCLIVLILFSCFLLPPAYAQGEIDYSVEISQKFGRGLVNVLSSPLEIPCVIRDEVEEKGGTGIVTGLFRGIVFMCRRILVGVTEVATFIIPMEETLPPVCSKRPSAAIHQ